MRKYRKAALVLAAMVMGTTAIGCGSSSTNATGSTQTGTQEAGSETTEKETEEETTMAPDMTETNTEAVIEGGKLVGINERYQMPLSDDSWKIDSQSEERVELSSGSNKITLQYLIGSAADDVDMFYSAGEYEAYRQETEELQNTKLVYYKDCAISGEMDGYVAAVTEESQAKISAAFGFPNTSESYVVYTVNAELSGVDEDTVQSVAEAVSQFTALRSASSVQTPQEADGSSTEDADGLSNTYTDTNGRFELALPDGDWAADESTAGTVVLSNNGQKITVSIAEGDAAAAVLIPSSYEEFYANLIPESESGADEQEVLEFKANASEESCSYELRYYDEYVTDVKYVKESRIRKDGTVYTVRAEYTKDADEATVEQGMRAVDTFSISE
ncbi:MAG: hypothetical protein Q4D90_11530 [bacterium]|nr:hypothetical protein [bacterium]